LTTFAGLSGRVAIDLDERILHKKARRANGRAGWRHLEMLLPDLIETIEVIQVHQKDLSLDDIVERSAGGLKSLRHILQDKVRLKIYVGAVKRKIWMLARLLRHARFEVAGKLPGSEDKPVGKRGLRVIRKRLRNIRLNHFYTHYPFPS
jgi:hypothetical protein